MEPFRKTDRLSDIERAMLLGTACGPRLMAGRQRKLSTPFWLYRGDEVGSANYRYWPRPPTVGLLDGRKRRVAVIEKTQMLIRRSTQLDPLECVLVKVAEGSRAAVVAC